MMLDDPLEWELELLAGRFKRLAKIAMREGLNPQTGIRWYRSEGALWMLGDADYLVAFILEESTADPHRAMEMVENGRVMRP